MALIPNTAAAQDFVEQARNAGQLIPHGAEPYDAEMNPIRVQPGLLAGVGLPPLGPRVVQMLSMESMVVPGTRDGRVVPRRGVFDDKA